MTKTQKDFELGQVVITRTALAVLPLPEVTAALDRHSQGDWGDVTTDDWEANDQALEFEDRLLSVYHTTGGLKFWVITDADRLGTTVLLPEDY